MKNTKYIKLNKKDCIKIVELLDKEYPDAKCSLDFSSTFSLIVALILAAQNTDKNVNEVTPLFFDKFKNIEDAANANLEDIKSIIKTCGFYNSKAKYIQNTSRYILENGIPDTMDGLVKLPGIGRKSANIIMQECYHKTCGIAVDTHVTRLSFRMGLSNGNSQEQIEKDLTSLFPKKYYSKVNHLFVYHGRAICTAKKPNCEKCAISEICKKNDRN